MPSKKSFTWIERNQKKPINKQAFLFKLHRALDLAEKDGMQWAFGWLSHGRAFKIYNRDVFKNKILPLYMGMNNYASFLRQCSLYNFNRLTRASGIASYGAHYNEYFLRGRIHLCTQIKRSQVKGTVIRPAARFDEEPNFFDMSPCKRDSVVVAKTNYEQSETSSSKQTKKQMLLPSLPQRAPSMKIEPASTKSSVMSTSFAGKTFMPLDRIDDSVATVTHTSAGFNVENTLMFDLDNNHNIANDMGLSSDDVVGGIIESGDVNQEQGLFLETDFIESLSSDLSDDMLVAEFLSYTFDTDNSVLYEV